jgi:glycine/D-amino acid oxidase-like deaminating enzyme
MSSSHSKQEHTGSYYAATANTLTRYPELKGNQKVDICVVGGGFTGVATALTLAERGYKVAIVEANRIGWGASGRNGGQLICGVSGEHKVLKKHGPGIADMMWNLRWRGNDIIHERVEKYSIDCDLKSGYIEVALRPRHLKALREDVEELDARGFPYEYRMLSREETFETLGTDAFLGSMPNMRNGHLHPLNLCAGEARAAAALGVQIYEQSPVKRIRHGSRPAAVTALGEVEAETVVLAGNAYHQLERRSLSGLTFPAGSYIIATEPLPEEVRNEINPLDLAVCDLNEIVEYYRFSADGRMLYGGRCNYSGREPRNISGTIKPRMEKIYPQLAKYRIDYQWGGKLGIVVTRIPLLGQIGKNVFYCQGYSGHGVNATHIMGEVMADAVSGTMETFDLFAKMKQFRIPGGQWLGNQMVALGMLYYRLKDLR